MKCLRSKHFYVYEVSFSAHITFLECFLTGSFEKFIVCVETLSNINRKIVARVPAPPQSPDLKVLLLPNPLFFQKYFPKLAQFLFWIFLAVLKYLLMIFLSMVLQAFQRMLTRYALKKCEQKSTEKLCLKHAGNNVSMRYMYYEKVFKTLQRFEQTLFVWTFLICLPTKGPFT